MQIKKIIKGIKFLKTYIINNFMIRYKLFSPKPVQVYWNITDYCNFRCNMCTRWKEPVEKELEVSAKKMKEVIDDLVQWGVWKFGITGGEPFLRKDKVLEVVEYASKKGQWIHVGTNGSLIDKAMLQKLNEIGVGHISISIDGDEAVHDSIRQHEGSYRKIIDTIKSAKEFDIDVKINTVLTAKNLEDIFDVIGIAQEYSCPVFIQPYNPYNKKLLSSFRQENISEEDDNWVPMKMNEKLEKTIKKLIEFKKKNPTILLNDSSHLEQILQYFSKPFQQDMECTTGYRNIQIAANGDVVPCWGFPKSVGNIKEESIREIWNSTDFKEVRKKMKNCRILCISGCRFYPGSIQLIMSGIRKVLHKVRKK